MIKFSGPIPSGNKLWHMLLQLYAKQEGVVISYTITDDNGKDIDISTKEPYPWLSAEYSTIQWYLPEEERDV